MNSEFHTHVELWFMEIMYKTWMEGTHDKHNRKSLFLRDYWNKLDGVFGKMQIISYNFKILKHILIDS